MHDITKSSSTKNFTWTNKSQCRRGCFYYLCNCTVTRWEHLLSVTVHQRIYMYCSHMKFWHDKWKEKWLKSDRSLPTDMWVSITKQIYVKRSILQNQKDGHLEVLHKSLQIILTPVLESSCLRIWFTNAKAWRTLCYVLVTKIAADLAEQKYLSHLMNSCQSARPWWRYMSEMRNLKSGEKYSSRRVQVVVNSGHFIEHNDKNIELAIYHRDYNRLGQIGEKKDTVLEYIYVFGW